MKPTIIKNFIKNSEFKKPVLWELDRSIKFFFNILTCTYKTWSLGKTCPEITFYFDWSFNHKKTQIQLYISTESLIISPLLNVTIVRELIDIKHKRFVNKFLFPIDFSCQNLIWLVKEKLLNSLHGV